MSEYIGARISLISKSDIRYCGTLHEINSEKATVALENVFSYGTEGRKGNPEEEIAPSETPYEYIVFRGSDVKDLRIEDAVKENKPPQPPVPNDPAILGAGSRPQPPNQAPAQGHFQNQRVPQQQQQPQFPGEYPPYPGFQGPRFGPQGGFPGGPGGPGAMNAYPGYPHPPYGAPMGWYPPPGPGGMQPGQFPHNQMPAGLPQPPQEKPAQEKPAQEAEGKPKRPTGGKPSSKTSTPIQPTNKPGPPPPVESKPDVAAALAPAPQVTTAAVAVSTAGIVPIQVTTAAQTAKAAPTGPKSNRIVPAVPIAPKGSAGHGQKPSSQAAPYTNATQAATAAVAAAMAKLSQPTQASHPAAPAPTANAADPMDNLTKKVADMRAADHANQARSGPSRGGYNDNGYHSRGGRGYRRGGGGVGHHRQHNHATKVAVPDTDFDFESSNAKFNKQDLVKEAIATGTPIGEHGDSTAASSTNGAADTNGDSNGKDDVAIPPPASYNKSTSFFDDISSELKDRNESNRRMGGPDFRNQERRKNVETFGQGSVDGNRGYRGGYRGRGRGGHRGRGRGGGGYGGRGGPRRGGAEAGLA